MCAGLQEKRDADESPDLTRISAGAKRPVERYGSRQRDHGEVEGIRKQKIHRRGWNKNKVETQRENDGGDEEKKKAREPARRKQGNLSRELRCDRRAGASW